MEAGIGRSRDERGYWRRALETTGLVLPILGVVVILASAWMRQVNRADWEPALEAALSRDRAEAERRDEELRAWLARVEVKLDQALLRMPR